MHIFYSEDRGQNWEGTFGFTRQDVLAKIVQRDWLAQHLAPDAFVVARELHDRSFAFGIDIYRTRQDRRNAERVNGDDLALYHGRKMTLDTSAQFEIFFAYRGVTEDMRIRNIHFLGHPNEGMGRGFLGEVVQTGLDLGAARTFVEPSWQGAWFWPRMGALIKSERIFEERDYVVEEILRYKDHMTQGWSTSDYDELARIFETRDRLGLNKFIARDGLLVEEDQGLVPAHKYLLEDAVLGECVFDYEDPWTQTCLMRQTGFDLTSRRANAKAQLSTRPKSQLQSHPTLVPS